MFLLVFFVIDYLRGEVNVEFNLVTTNVSCGNRS